MAQENQTPLAVIFLDLDHFKHVNDSLGHRVGDVLLVEIAKRLRAVVRDKDTVSRLGGDEFILLLPGADARGAARGASKLQEASRQPYQIDHHELTMAPSMGIALFPQDGHDFDTLTQSADVAMYRAKLDGRNTFRFFTPEMQAQSVRALQLENALRRALEREQFHLHYQPQMNLATGTVRSVEALLRWQHPQLGAISPGEFIPIAEDSGQILQIGEWVLRTALAQLKAWRSCGFPELTMAVNLSAIQFRQPQLPELVSRVLAEFDLPPDSLELELTEGVAVDDPHAAVATMDQLHARGVRMSMDDFGTGYSSLSQLKRFQIFKLKIDQSFVRDWATTATTAPSSAPSSAWRRRWACVLPPKVWKPRGNWPFYTNKVATKRRATTSARHCPRSSWNASCGNTHQHSERPQDPFQRDGRCSALRR